jgi:proteasome alpha subunit
MTLVEALRVATAALAGQANDERPEITAAQLEVAVLDRSRPHRMFRRLTGARLEALLAEARPAAKPATPAEPAGQDDGPAKNGGSAKNGGPAQNGGSQKPGPQPDAG